MNKTEKEIVEERSLYVVVKEMEFDYTRGVVINRYHNLTNGVVVEFEHPFK